MGTFEITPELLAKLEHFRTLSVFAQLTHTHLNFVDSALQSPGIKHQHGPILTLGPYVSRTYENLGHFVFPQAGVQLELHDLCMVVEVEGEQILVRSLSFRPLLRYKRRISSRSGEKSRLETKMFEASLPEVAITLERVYLHDLPGTTYVWEQDLSEVLVGIRGLKVSIHIPPSITVD